MNVQSNFTDECSNCSVGIPILIRQFSNGNVEQPPRSVAQPTPSSMSNTRLTAAVEASFMTALQTQPNPSRMAVNKIFIYKLIENSNTTGPFVINGYDDIANTKSEMLICKVQMALLQGSD